MSYGRQISRQKIYKNGKIKLSGPESVQYEVMIWAAKIYKFSQGNFVQISTQIHG
jgi:hypothetical protein